MKIKNHKIKMNGDPKKPKKTGYAAVLKSNVKGELVQDRPKNYGGITTTTLKEDAKHASGASIKQGFSGPAPRTGGTVMKSSGVPMGGTKKQIKAAKVRVKKSGASKAAKRSAMKLY